MEILFTSKLFKVVRTFVVGRSGKRLERHVIIHPGSVALIPVLDDGRIVLLKQFRVAVDQYLYEIPAGTLDPDEEPRETARRELIEETGYVPNSLLEIATIFPSPGILREKMHIFLASDLVAGPTDREDGEDIETTVLTLDEAVGMIDSGEIQDAKTIVGLLWYWRKLQLDAQKQGDG